MDSQINYIIQPAQACVYSSNLYISMCKTWMLSRSNTLLSMYIGRLICGCLLDSL